MICRGWQLSSVGPEHERQGRWPGLVVWRNQSTAMCLRRPSTPWTILTLTEYLDSYEVFLDVLSIATIARFLPLLPDDTQGRDGWLVRIEPVVLPVSWARCGRNSWLCDRLIWHGDHHERQECCALADGLSRRNYKAESTSMDEGIALEKNKAYTKSHWSHTATETDLL